MRNLVLRVFVFSLALVWDGGTFTTAWRRYPLKQRSNNSAQGVWAEGYYVQVLGKFNIRRFLKRCHKQQGDDVRYDG